MGRGELDFVPESGKPDLLVTLDLSGEFAAKKQNLQVIYFHRFAQSDKTWKSIVSTAKNWLETWPKEPVLDGQSALEIFKFEDTSLWWFVYDAIWETKNGIFDTIYLVVTLRLLIREYKPSEIELVGRFDSPIDLILELMAEKESFKLVKNQNYKSKIDTQNELNRPSGKLSLLARLFFLKVAMLASRSTKNPNVVFFLNHGSTTIVKSQDGSELISDHYLEGLDDYMAKSRNDKLIVSLNMPLINSSYYNNLVADVRRTAKRQYIPWLSYYSLSELFSWKRLTQYYFDKILSMEKDPDFRESLQIEGIDIYPMLRNVFRGNLVRALAYVNIEINLARKFVMKEKPHAVFHTRGISASGRAICFACNSKGIKVMAPQLGIISPEYPVNTAFAISKDYDLRLLPICLTWGNFYSEMIVSRGYPENLVRTVGFWRTEVSADHKPDGSESLLYVAGANLNKLDYILSLDEELATIKSIREVAPKKLKMIVKLHPSLPIEPYQNALNKLEGVELIGGPNTPSIEEFLAKAAVVVGKASTVLIQALILRKPLIVVNFASELDFLGIDGVPFATNTEQFSHFLTDILDGRGLALSPDRYCSPTGQASISKIVGEIGGMPK